jgi:hypothetical protein
MKRWINICFKFYTKLADFFLKFKYTAKVSRRCKDKAWEYGRLAQYEYEYILRMFEPEIKFEYVYSFTHVPMPKKFDVFNKWINRYSTQIKICERYNNYTRIYAIEDMILFYMTLDEDSDLERMHLIEDVFNQVVFYLTVAWADIPEHNSHIQKEITLLKALI